MEIKFVNAKLIKYKNDFVVMLREEKGTRIFQISLNLITASLLGYEMYAPKGTATIFRFELECLDALEASLEKVVIDGVGADNVYHATVYVKDHKTDRVYKLKRHVTHAIIMAVAADCPIFVDDGVFQELEARDKKRSMELEKTKNFLDKLNPDKKKN